MTFRTYLAGPWADVDGRRSSHGDSVAVLDGIRGLAVLIVLASHTGAFGMAGQGSVGVFLFFALSGFVLMLPFAERPARIFQLREVWHYVANRALRIVPLYVAAVLFLRWYMSEPWPWAWLNLSFYAGWNHLWSVAEEVRFYLLFPFVVGLLALLPSRAWRIAALMAMMVFAWALRNQHRVDLLIDGTTFEFYFYFFLAGMLACLMYRATGWHPIKLAYVTTPSLWSLLSRLLSGWMAASRAMVRPVHFVAHRIDRQQDCACEPVVRFLPGSRRLALSHLAFSQRHLR